MAAGCISCCEPAKPWAITITGPGDALSDRNTETGISSTCAWSIFKSADGASSDQSPVAIAKAAARNTKKTRLFIEPGCFRSRLTRLLDWGAWKRNRQAPRTEGRAPAFQHSQAKAIPARVKNIRNNKPLETQSDQDSRSKYQELMALMQSFHDKCEMTNRAVTFKLDQRKQQSFSCIATGLPYEQPLLTLSQMLREWSFP
ncbi:hypothetical protein GGD83_001013 [Rhodoblastus sphagnicola]|nr:hypothetical protein [Rhodoblastus sphagnicola]